MRQNRTERLNFGQGKNFMLREKSQRLKGKGSPSVNKGGWGEQQTETMRVAALSTGEVARGDRPLYAEFD